MVWDYLTFTLIQSIQLTNIQYVSRIRVTRDNLYLLVLGVKKDYSIELLYIEITSLKIKSYANLEYQFIINDL